MKNLQNLLLNSLFNKFSVETTEVILDWISKSNFNTKVSLEKVDLLDLEKWNFGPNEISHDSGKFFSVTGIRISGNVDRQPVYWEQPIINQPEIGYLGIVCREFKGVLHFLLQAKIEPGNVNKVQLSPTIQATKSNFTKVHNGNSTPYLDEFQNCNISDVILDQLQSEQGARFLQKRNRNIIIINNKIEPVDDRFKWLNLFQIKKLMLEDNLVNMDTRTVIGCLSLNLFSTPKLNKLKSPPKIFKNFEYFSNNNNIFPSDTVLAWLTKKKLLTDLKTEVVPLVSMNEWKCTIRDIRHVNNLFFKVVGVNVKIENREVVKWSQPMIEPNCKGHIALFYSKFNNNIYFLVRAKFEIGSFDKLELGPTIQTSKSRLGEVDIFVYEIMKNSKKVLSVFQSEEGGRFYQEENLNEIYEIEYFNIDINDSDLIWLSYTQIQEMMKFSAIVNIQLRTMMSLLYKITF
jgi:oxidase EvaA